MTNKMTSCPEIEQLRALIGGEVNASNLNSLNGHIERCEDCQHRLDQLTSANPLEAISQSAVATPQGQQLSDAEQAVVNLLKSQGVHESPLPLENEQWDQPTASGERFLDQYAIHRLVGEGTTGQLFLASDLRLGREVALKVLHQNLCQDSMSRTRLQREARATAGLQHDHIVTLYDFVNRPGQTPYLVMEYNDGYSLEDWINTSGPLHPADAAQITKHIASALAFAHTAGVIHRDVKCSNILIDRHSRHAKITDFGLARAVDSDSQLTTEGMIAGTPAYMSPEQILDPRNADQRSDVYSLGIVLYQMLTGVLPFRGTPRMTLMQVQHHEPTMPRQLNDQIPVDLETICLKAISKEPTSRYASAKEMQADLARFLGNRPILARRTGWLGRAGRWRKRNPTIAGLWLCVAIISLLALGIVIASSIQLRIANAQLIDANLRASEAAKTASFQRDATIRTLRKLVTDVPKALAEIPEDTSDVEQLVSQIAIDGLAEVSNAIEDSQGDLTAAMGHYQLGATLWRVNQLSEAEKHLQMALAIVGSPAPPATIDEPTLELLCDTHLHLGNIDFDHGRLEQMRTHLQTGLTLADEFLNNYPSSFTARLKKASLLDSLSQCLIEVDDNDSAEATLEKCKALLGELATERPNSADVLTLVDFHQSLHEYYHDESDRRAGGHRSGRSAKLNDPLSDLSSEELQQEFSDAIADANAAAEHEDLVDEADCLDRAHFAATLLHSESPSDEAAIELAALEVRMGTNAREDMYPKIAQDNYRAALNLLTSLQQSDNERVAALMLAAQCGEALTLVDRGRYEKATPMLQKLQQELSTGDSPTVLTRMHLIDLQIGLSYTVDHSIATLKTMHDDLEKTIQQLVSDPGFRQVPRRKLWHANVQVEMDALSDDLAEQVGQLKSNPSGTIGL